MPVPEQAKLLVEHCYWLYSRVNEPIKTMHVTGSRALSLVLPSGRHTFRLLISATRLGHFLTVLGKPRLHFAPNESQKGGASDTLTLHLGDEESLLRNALTNIPLRGRQIASRLVDLVREAATKLLQLSQPENVTYDEQRVEPPTTVAQNQPDDDMLPNVVVHAPLIRANWCNEKGNLLERLVDIRAVLSELLGPDASKGEMRLLLKVSVLYGREN